ncbi:hypothetical protein ABPG74_006043 [Tetrahymena malaccensis]
MHIPDQQRKQITQCCSIFAVVLFIIILFISWDTVEVVHYGLLCNSVSKACSQKSVYSAGRHWVWPTYYFIYFPSNLLTIEFSDSMNANPPLRTRTAEGLSLELFLSFEYQLIKEEIPELYSMNNLEYERTFIRIARDTIVQIASTFEANEYWTKRPSVTQAMKDELTIELKKAHANCVFFQLLRIDLPDSYEMSIVNTQIEMQNKRTKQFEQEATKIMKEIEVLRSETEKDIKTINAEAQSESYQILKNSEAKANQYVLEAEIDSFSDAANQNNLDLDDDELNDYIYYTSLIKKKNAKILVGMDNIQARIDSDS